MKLKNEITLVAIIITITLFGCTLNPKGKSNTLLGNINRDLTLILRKEDSEIINSFRLIKGERAIAFFIDKDLTKYIVIENDSNMIYIYKLLR